MRPVPLPAGLIRTVTSELAQTGFPVTARCVSGTALVAYGHGLGHVSAGAQTRLRRQPLACEVWSEPAVLWDIAGDYSLVPAGLAAETAAFGGRVFMLLSRAKAASSTTGADYSAQLSYSDDEGLNWSTPASLPTATPGMTVASGLFWSPDEGGTLFATVYGGPSGAPAFGTVFASTDRGTTWTKRADVRIPAGTPATTDDRTVTEPTLVRLLDGRLLMAIRSDGAPIAGTNPTKYYYSYLYTCESTDGGSTWSVPKQTVAYASGLPAMHVTSTGHVAIMYRGQSEPGSTPVGYTPTRVTMIDPDTVLAYDGQRDLVFGDRRRFMYGSFLPGAGGFPDRMLWGAENTPQSNPAGTTTIYELPLTWVDQPE